MAGITATYVDADTFTVSSDMTLAFIEGRRVKCDCGANGYKYGTVESSSYGALTTTVNLIDTNDDLTVNLVAVWFGIVAPGTLGSFPKHPHGITEGSGGDIGFVNVKAQGAVGDGTTDDTTAIQAAFDAGGKVFFPSGEYLCGEVTIGDDTFVSGEEVGTTIITSNGSFSGTYFWSILSKSNVFIKNFTFDVSAHNTVSAILAYSCDNVTICDVKITEGYVGVLITDTTNSLFERICTTDTNNIGIQNRGTSGKNNIIKHCIAVNGAHGIQAWQGSDHKIIDCIVSGSSQFGISVYDTDRCLVSGNTSYDTTLEGINLLDCYMCKATDNSVYWTGSDSTDFGISLWGNVGTCTFNLISNNSVIGSAKAGIALADDCSFNTVNGNKISNCNLTEVAQHGGVLLYGASCANNLIESNTIHDSLSNMEAGVSLIAGTGINRIVNNFISGITPKIDKVDTSSEALNIGSYTTYTPTITAATGTITAKNADGYYYELEKLVFVSLKITITTNGTGADAVKATLPFTAANIDSQFTGREVQSTGKQLSGNITANGTDVFIRTYDNSYPADDGYVLIVTGFYQRV